jgi:hypothetical protein
MLVVDPVTIVPLGEAAAAMALLRHRTKPKQAVIIILRTKPTAKPEQTVPAKRRRGRPRKGEVRPSAPVRRIERQGGMSLAAMLADLPRHCDVGAKRNAKGHQESWIGYKLHIDTADGEIPISCVLTAASVHDSQVSIVWQ